MAIGTDEHTVCDKFGNVCTVRRTLADHERVKAIFRKAGFVVTGDTVHATRSEAMRVFDGPLFVS